MRDRAATLKGSPRTRGEASEFVGWSALVLGLLALWFGVFAPFAIFSATRSLRRIRASQGKLRGTAAATGGLLAGLVAMATIVAGVAYWLLNS